MGRLNKILFSSRQLFKDTRNKIEHGIKSLEDIIEENVKIDGFKNKLGSLGDRIEENLKIVKYIIPSALMATFSLNTYGRIGYYGSQAFIYSRMAKGNADAGHLMYGKTPYVVYVVSAISGIVGLTIGILLGDISGLYNLFHHNNDIGIPQLSHNDTNPSSVTNYNNSTVYNNDNITINNNITTCNSSSATNYNNSTISKLENEINSLQNLLKEDNQTISNLEDKLQNDTNIINIYQNQLNQYNQTISNLQDQVQNLQNSLALEKILYANSNSSFAIIQFKSVNINNGTVSIPGIVYPSGKEVILESPTSYVGNGYLNIYNFSEVANNNGYNTYIVLDRPDLQYMTLNNQTGTPIITIQPNEPVHIAVMASPDNATVINNALNNLPGYNKVIQDSLNNSLPSYALWGWVNPIHNSVVIDFSNSTQYYQALKEIGIADKMLISTNNKEIINNYNLQNPTNTGIIYTYNIFIGNGTTYKIGKQSYIGYNVGPIYIPIIELMPEQGIPILISTYS